MPEMAPIDKDAPVMKAWEAYTATDEYANTKRWATHHEHTEGSLWAAFVQGWSAAMLWRAMVEAAIRLEQE